MHCGLGPGEDYYEGTRIVFEGESAWWYPAGEQEPSHDLLARASGGGWRLPWENTEPPKTEAEVEASFRRVRTPEERLAGGQGAYTQRFLEVFGEEYWCYPWISGPFWALYHTFGFRGLMENMVLQPELVLHACQMMAKENLAQAEALAQAGLRKGYVFDAFCGSDLISIPQYEQVVFPPIRELVEGMKRAGYEDIVFCHLGGIDERVDLLAELPVAALAFEESKKGFVIDLGWIRERVGPDLTLWGNTDILFLRDAEREEQIQEDTRRQYEQAGPRFVASIGSPLAEDTEAEKVWWMLRAAEGLR
jgi:hypothetical protein